VSCWGFLSISQCKGKMKRLLKIRRANEVSIRWDSSNKKWNWWWILLNWRLFSNFLWNKSLNYFFSIRNISLQQDETANLFLISCYCFSHFEVFFRFKLLFFKVSFGPRQFELLKKIQKRIFFYFIWLDEPQNYPRSWSGFLE